jgi:hypothetical protein
MNARRKETPWGLPRATWGFSPFVVSADGLLGKEAKILLRKLSAMLAEKAIGGTLLRSSHGCLNARVRVTIFRAIHLCIRRSRDPVGKMSNRLPQWEDKAGLGLFQQQCSTATEASHNVFSSAPLC